MKIMNSFRKCLFIIIVLFYQSSFPQNGLSWRQTNGPFGGNIQSITSGKNGRLYALDYGREFSRIFYSTDGGNNWQILRDDISHVVGDSPLTVTKSGNIIISGFNGVTICDENGGNSTFNTIPNCSNVYCIKVDSLGNIWAGTDMGVYFSNNGSSWKQVNTGLGNTRVSSIGINSIGYIFASTGNGVYISANSGNNWQKISSSLYETSLGFLVVDNKDNLIVSNSGYGDLYKTSDNGDSWTIIKNTSDKRISGMLVRNLWCDSIGVMLKLEYDFS